MNCPNCHYDVIERLNADRVTPKEQQLVNLAGEYQFASRWLEGAKQATFALYAVVGNIASGVCRCTACNHVWRVWRGWPTKRRAN